MPRDGDPASHPRATPTSATALDSRPLSRRSCHRCAPDHVSRRRAASRSRRMPRAARIVNARSSAAPSPPTSRSRVPATFADRSAVAKLLDGCVDAERRRPLGELDPRSLAPRDELVDLPQPRRSRSRRATPTRTCDTCERAPETPRARRALLRRRAAEAAGRWYSLVSAELGRNRRIRRRQRRRTGGSRRTADAIASVAVPTSTSRRPGASGSAPRPRSRSTSQRSGAHLAAAAPTGGCTWSPTPSIAVIPTKRPATVLSRNRTSGVGPSRPNPANASSTASSSDASRSLESPGIPNQAARTDRSDAGMRSIACAVARSVAIVTPASTPARTAVATTSPSMATSAPLSRRRRRLQASPATTVADLTRPALCRSPIRGRLRPVPADRHRAPRRRRVPRRVEEQPAAVRAGTRLEPPPDTGRLRLEDARQDLRRDAPSTPSSAGLEPHVASLAEVEAQRRLSRRSPRTPPAARRPAPRRACSASQAREGRRAARAPARTSPRPRSRRSRRGRATGASSREQLRGRDVVHRPHGDLGVHEVLDEIERRRRRRAAGRLESGRNRHRRKSIGGVLDTVNEKRRCSALHAVHGPPGCLPRVVRGARPEPGLVPDDRAGCDPTSLARCACQRRFGSSRSSHTSTRCAAVMKSATNVHPSAGQGNGSVRTQNQPPWSPSSSPSHSSSSDSRSRSESTAAPGRSSDSTGAQ